METQNEGMSQQGATPPSTGTEGNQTPALNTTHSDLAAGRAQRQGSAPTAGTQSSSGSAVPDSQQANQAPRSEYIPRERFDEVNSKRIAAEAQLQQLTQMTQAQQQAAARANTGQYHQPQAQGHQVAQAPAVQDFISSLSSKEEQEKWRQKIVNQPVTGIAELIQHAIRTEGTALLQNELQHLQSTLAPLQQFYHQQQNSAAMNYVKSRQSDPGSNWDTVQPVFQQLATTAVQQGYQLTQQNLQVIEGLARTQVGLPLWGSAPQSTGNVPFTERPAGGGFSPQQQQPVLTADQKKVASMMGVDEATYARNLQAIRGGQQ